METKEYFKNYANFVDSVTSEASKNDDLFLHRFEELSKQLNGNFSRLDTAVTGLSAEAGEVLDVWKKVKYHGLIFDDDVKDKFIKELGDVCWYLFQTSMALGVPVNEIIDANINKLKERHSNGFSPRYMHK